MEKNKSKEFREITRVLERNLELVNASDCSLCDISTAQCHMIVEIGRNTDSMLKDLAAALRIDVSTASKVVEELVKKGLVKREPSNLDRRSVQINLSDKGREIFEKIECDMDLIFDEIFSLIETSEQDTLLHAISLYNQALSQWKEAKGHE